VPSAGFLRTQMIFPSTNEFNTDHRNRTKSG
jgi:hypothetical protein